MPRKPRRSTATDAASRHWPPTLGRGHVFGSNMLAVALLLPADLASTSGPILRAEDTAAVLLPLLVGIAVTGIYVVGLLERANRTFLRLGYDSIAVLVVWLGGLGALFVLR